MAKTPKPKKRVASKHSRAARREASPSLGAHESRKTAAPPTEPAKSSIPFFSTHNAGISKKKQRQRHLSRQQKLRQSRGVQRADANVDKLETKIARSVRKGKKVNARKADWDHLNAELSGKKVCLPVEHSRHASKERDGADEMEDVEEVKSTMSEAERTGPMADVEEHEVLEADQMPDVAEADTGDVDVIL